MACFSFFFVLFGPSINKNEPRYRVTIMSLLTTLWICISQSTSPFSVMWPARPIQLGWCRFTWPRLASRQVAAPFGSRACCFLSAFSPTLTKSAAATSTAHTFLANQLSCLFTNVFTTTPAAACLRLTKEQEKSTTPPRQPTKSNATSGKTFSANSSWPSVRQPHLTISSLLKPKTSKFFLLIQFTAG